jgi:hypothetical protein
MKITSIQMILAITAAVLAFSSSGSAKDLPEVQIPVE